MRGAHFLGLHPSSPASIRSEQMPPSGGCPAPGAGGVVMGTEFATLGRLHSLFAHQEDAADFEERELSSNSVSLSTPKSFLLCVMEIVSSSPFQHPSVHLSIPSSLPLPSLWILISICLNSNSNVCCRYFKLHH